MASRKRRVGRWEDDHRLIKHKKKCRNVQPQAPKTSAEIGTLDCLCAGCPTCAKTRISADYCGQFKCPWQYFSALFLVFYMAMVVVLPSPNPSLTARHRPSDCTFHLHPWVQVSATILVFCPSFPHLSCLFKKQVSANKWNYLQKVLKKHPWMQLVQECNYLQISSALKA